MCANWMGPKCLSSTVPHFSDLVLNSSIEGSLFIVVQKLGAQNDPAIESTKSKLCGTR